MLKEMFEDQDYYFESSRADPIIIDCGCNIGMSIIYFKSLFPAAKIIGFEPNPNTFEILQKNILNNKLENVILHNSALSNVDGRSVLYGEIKASEPYTLGNTIMENIWGNIDFNVHCDQVAVRCEKLSPYLTGEIDYLKLDVEGAEQLVLQECAEKLANVKNIFIEFHGSDNVKQKNNLDSILGLLKKAGFACNVTKMNPDDFIPVDDEASRKIRSLNPVIATIKAENVSLKV